MKILPRLVMAGNKRLYKVKSLRSLLLFSPCAPFAGLLFQTAVFVIVIIAFPGNYTCYHR